MLFIKWSRGSAGWNVLLGSSVEMGTLAAELPKRGRGSGDADDPFEPAIGLRLALRDRLRQCQHRPTFPLRYHVHQLLRQRRLRRAVCIHPSRAEFFARISSVRFILFASAHSISFLLNAPWIGVPLPTFSLKFSSEPLSQRAA